MVGTFYAAPAPDADPYVSQNERITAGQVVCIVEAMKLMNEIESEVSGRIAEMPKEVASCDLAEAVLSIVTAPARLLDKSAQFGKKGSPVKIQGQWRQPIERSPESGLLTGLSLKPAIFYQNTDSSLIDMLQFSSVATGKTLTVRGYDYGESTKGGPLVPARIEIFTTDTQANAQDRLVKIDAHTLGPAK